MIEKAMAGLPLIGLHFNGGIYMIELEGSGKMSDVLKRIVDADIPVTYIRDISQSTRRLFVK
jgi:ABC-2 type transport system ATP-binding protein